jgi:hypothetical protein
VTSLLLIAFDVAVIRNYPFPGFMDALRGPFYTALGIALLLASLGFGFLGYRVVTTRYKGRTRDIYLLFLPPVLLVTSLVWLLAACRSRLDVTLATARSTKLDRRRRTESRCLIRRWWHIHRLCDRRPHYRRYLAPAQGAHQCSISGEGSSSWLERDVSDDLRSSSVALAVHSTTLVTNSIIERKGARTALLTTRGFRDILELAREQMYDIYDLFAPPPEPLIARPYRLEIDERTMADGEILARPSEESINAAIADSEEGTHRGRRNLIPALLPQP